MSVRTCYRKYILSLLLSSLTMAAAWFCAEAGRVCRETAGAAAYACEINPIHEVTETSVRKDMEEILSKKRVMETRVLEKRPVRELSETDYDTLLRIVEAEAGGEDENGKLLVANVVLNRVDSPLFPDTVREVVYQQDYGVYQFSPVKDGRINQVEISNETVKAVERAIYGEDLSQGALYFAARQAAASDKMQWFDQNLTRLFAYGGHEFFG